MPSHYLNQCRIISEIKIELRQISLWKVTNYRLIDFDLVVDVVYSKHEIRLIRI